MKKLLSLAIGVAGLVVLAGLARADDPVKQEGRIWVDTNMLLKINPNWSWTTMPGFRDEFYRSRESNTGLHFLEFFFGPDYTYKSGDFTFKGSLWYYYMGYPQRGRLKEQTADNSQICDTDPPGATDAQRTWSPKYCASKYNASHNIEIIPSLEYRFGRWSIYDRVILHNTFYADVYGKAYAAPDNAASTLSVSDQRWGWATVLRELVRVRYAVTDKLGVFLSDEIFVTLLEDGDTSGMKKADGSPAGYHPMGYWKSGFRYNRTYLGIDYVVTPNLVVAPSYMIEVGLNYLDSADVTDITHTFFLVTTISTSLFDPPKK
jgi:hypothetical protein